MLQRDQDFEISFDLDKPLPPSPQPDTDSSRSSQTCIKDSWTAVLKSAEAGSVPQQTNLNSVADPNTNASRVQGFDIGQTTSSALDLLHKTETTHSKRSPDIQTVEQTISRTMNTDGSPLSLHTHSQLTQLPQERHVDDVFKSFSYDEMDQRPIKFYPQGQLMDLPKRKKRRKISLVNLFRRSASRHSNKVTSIDKPIKLRTPSLLVRPPRPPRPLRHLCPSPPYNPANMPTWRTSEALDDDKQVNNGTSGLSTFPGESNFISLADLRSCEESISRRMPSEMVASTLLTESTKRVGTQIPDTHRHSSSSRLGLFKDEDADESWPGERVARCKRQPYKYEVANQHRNKNYKHTVGELPHVPEDRSIHSFSNKACQDSEAGRKCSYLVHPGSNVSRADSKDGHSPSIYSQRDSFWGSDTQLKKELEEEHDQCERERVKNVSKRLREQYRTEWDDTFNKRLSNTASIVGSRSTPDLSRPSDVPAVEPEFVLSRNGSYGNIKPLKSYPSSIESIDLPTLSSTMARIAELCDQHATNPESPTRPYISPDSDAIEAANRYSHWSELSPAPLRSGHHGNYSSYQPTLGQNEMDRLKPRKKHEFSLSPSSPPRSFNRQDRVFSDSALNRDSVASSWNELDERYMESDSRPISPLLPPLPLRGQHPLTPPNQRDLKPLPPIPHSIEGSENVWANHPTDQRYFARLTEDHATLHNTQRTGSIDQHSGFNYQCVGEVDPNDATYEDSGLFAPVFSTSLSETPPKSSPPPPPIPERSYLRPHSSPQWSDADATKADLNGQLTPATEVIEHISESTTTPYEPDVDQLIDNQATSRRRHLIHRPRPQAVYNPFKEMLYRGRSIKYHVSPNGETSF